MVNVPGGHDHTCAECGEEFLCPTPAQCDHLEGQACETCYRLHFADDAAREG